MSLQTSVVHHPSAERSADGSAADRPSPQTLMLATARPATHALCEQVLVKAVVAGDPTACERFIDTVSATLWSIVTKLAGDGNEGEAAFLDLIAALKADGCARLKGFDGKARLSTHIVLVARDILAERLARRLSEAPRNAWRQFQRFFERDIRRKVEQRLGNRSSATAREDAYQEICLKLVENDFRCIRAYDGRGSFVGYVLTTVDHALIDLLRRVTPRRRTPAAVARLASLDQEVYAAIAWEGHPVDADRLVPVLAGRLDRDPDATDITAALARIATVARLEPASRSRPARIVSLDALAHGGSRLALADTTPTPEDWLLLAEEERSRANLVDAVKAAAAALPAEERLYLETVFAATDPMPPRQIAKIMGCAVEDVYRLRQRVQRWIKEIAMRLEKNPDRSVYGTTSNSTRYVQPRCARDQMASRRRI
jgi:RNA polymerase primary sigma factor